MNSVTTDPISIALCGDVMTGRGVDQILPHPGDPVLHEDCVRDAREYVGLAARVNGPIPFPVDFEYVWGGALAELRRAEPRTRDASSSVAEPCKWSSGRSPIGMKPGRAWLRCD